MHKGLRGIQSDVCLRDGVVTGDQDTLIYNRIMNVQLHRLHKYY